MGDQNSKEPNSKEPNGAIAAIYAKIEQLDGEVAALRRENTRLSNEFNALKTSITTNEMLSTKIREEEKARQDLDKDLRHKLMDLQNLGTEVQRLRNAIGPLKSIEDITKTEAQKLQNLLKTVEDLIGKNELGWKDFEQREKGRDKAFAGIWKEVESLQTDLKRYQCALANKDQKDTKIAEELKYILKSNNEEADAKLMENKRNAEKLLEELTKIRAKFESIEKTVNELEKTRAKKESVELLDTSIKSTYNAFAELVKTLQHEMSTNYGSLREEIRLKEETLSRQIENNAKNLRKDYCSLEEKIEKGLDEQRLTNAQNMERQKKIEKLSEKSEENLQRAMKDYSDILHAEKTRDLERIKGQMEAQYLASINELRKDMENGKEEQSKKIDLIIKEQQRYQETINELKESLIQIKNEFEKGLLGVNEKHTMEVSELSRGIIATLDQISTNTLTKIEGVKAESELLAKTYENKNKEIMQELQKSKQEAQTLNQNNSETLSAFKEALTDLEKKLGEAVTKHDNSIEELKQEYVETLKPIELKLKETSESFNQTLGKQQNSIGTFDEDIKRISKEVGQIKIQIEQLPVQPQKAPVLEIIGPDTIKTDGTAAENKTAEVAAPAETDTDHIILLTKEKPVEQVEQTETAPELPVAALQEQPSAGASEQPAVSEQPSAAVPVAAPAAEKSEYDSLIKQLQGATNEPGALDMPLDIIKKVRSIENKDHLPLFEKYEDNGNNPELQAACRKLLREWESQYGLREKTREGLKDLGRAIQ